MQCATPDPYGVGTQSKGITHFTRTSCADGISHLLQSGYQARKKNSVIEGEGQAHPTSKEFGKRVPETATTELTQLDPEPQATTQPATVCLGMFKY